MRTLAVIPARYHSTRLPAKPLADIHGKPMIQWVYESALQSRSVNRIIVATDDERIVQVVRSFNGEAMLTSQELRSGTDRVAAVSDQIQADVYVNVQGDEPLITPEAIDQAVELVRDRGFPMGTVMTPIRNPSDLNNLAVVKVIVNKQGKALYFSRHAIPYSRGQVPSNGKSFVCRQHVGLYTYTHETLQRIRSLPVSELEKAEMLEQLRAMEDGIDIGVSEVDFLSIGVDTPEELEAVRRVIFKKRLDKNG